VGWLRRAERSGRRFDRIVLDPPSFGTRGKGSVLSLDRDQASLLAGAANLLEPGGQLLVVSHHRRTSERALEASVRAACAATGRGVSVEPWVGGWDTPTLPGVSATKSVLAQLT